MFFDDEEPLAKPDRPQPARVEHFSIDELKESISWLDAEKSRAEGEIDRKQSATSAAEAFFKQD
jgi:uncharacterized small protein (DUF1192 family)